MFVDVFTDYSLLNSLNKIEKLVAYAKAKNWGYLGIADFASGGLLDFYLECKEANIKPILGLRFYITNTLEESTTSQVILYAQNLNGYHNLIKLSSRAAIDGFKDGRGNLLVDWLETPLATDLVCLLPIGVSPNEAHSPNGTAVTTKIRNIFKNKLFYGLCDRNTAFDDYWLKRAHSNNIQYIPLSAARYIHENDFRAFKTLRAINEGSSVYKMFETVYMDESLELAESKFDTYKHKDYYNKFLSLFDIDIPTPGLKVPKFPIPQQYKSSYDYLVDLCRKGYKTKILEFDAPEKVQACKERMAVELDVLKRCELADYFLMVYDICQYCDKNNIPRGISRGSCSGSLVTFLLDISRTNPLEYGLLFERFLNEDRTRPIEHNGERYLTAAPDIDLDIGQIQRQDVIEFLRKEYGHVCKIATYSTLTSKNCIKDVIRSHGGFEWQAAQIAKHVEVKFGKSDSLKETYKKCYEFREWAIKNKSMFSVAIKLEDIRKNCSIHAAGVLVSDKSIENFAPLYLANATEDGDFKRETCITYSLNYAEKASLLKVDILGIRSLNVLSDTISSII